MYYKYFSIFSLIIIAGFVITGIIGYKKGFLTKFLKLADIVCGFFMSVVFARKFSANITYRIFGSGLEKQYYDKIITSNAYQNVDSTLNSKTFLENLGVPKFIAKTISAELSIEECITPVASMLAKMVCVIISFFILWIGMWLLIKFLKRLVKKLRENKTVKVVDGILGIVFYLIIYYLCLSFVMVIILAVMQGDNAINAWIVKDFALDSNKFRISKWFYENNIIGNFLKMFFW